MTQSTSIILISTSTTTLGLITSGGSRGTNPAMALPIEVGSGVCPPLGGRNSNDKIVNLCKFQDFGPPNRCGLRIWPPYGKPVYQHIKQFRLKFALPFLKFWIR